MKFTDFRTAYDGRADHVSKQTGLECKDPSLAVQEQLEDADINTIVKRFGLTGELPVQNRVALPDAMFMDDVNYRECLDVVIAAEKSFASMPAAVRNRFENDPVKFVEFATDPDNLDECIKLGLAPKKEEVKEPPPIKVIMAEPQKPAGAGSPAP